MTYMNSLVRYQIKPLDVVRGFTGNDKLYAKECWGAVYEEGNGANPTYTTFYGVGHIM